MKKKIMIKKKKETRRYKILNFFFKIKIKLQYIKVLLFYTKLNPLIDNKN